MRKSRAVYATQTHTRPGSTLRRIGPGQNQAHGVDSGAQQSPRRQYRPSRTAQELGICHTMVCVAAVHSARNDNRVVVPKFCNQIFAGICANSWHRAQ